jgi:Flp pilus assembly pilin Flp
MDSGEVALKTRSGRPEAHDSGSLGAQDPPEALEGGLGKSVAPDATIAPPRGQTMVEYALIIAAVSVVAWSAYNFMGHDIVSMASGVDSSLTST